jgi:mercuric ion transport protein
MKGEDRAKRLSIGGAVLAAVAASACCLGPLLVAVLGMGGAGALAAFGAYRPHLLALTATLLAGGFYFAYREPRSITGDDGCGCERPRANRAGRLGLWVATVIVVLVAAAPPLLARLSATGHAPVALVPGQKLSRVSIEARGIDCEACAAPIRNALMKVGGLRDLRLDIASQSVTVAYEPAPGRLAAYVAAINELGYESRMPNVSEAKR